MTRDQLQAQCLRFPAAEEKLHPAPSNVLVYSVAGKSFAWFKTSEPERWRFSFRASAERFIELTDMPGVKPARYMGRFHWVTIVHIETFPADYLRELVQWSYARALQSLSKRRREAIATATQVAVQPSARTAR